MKGYWHITSICVCVSIITIYTKQYYLLFICVLWLFYLYYMRRLRKIHLLISLTFLIFFIFYIPEQRDFIETDSDFPEDITVTGDISRAISRTDEKIEFALDDKQSPHTFLIVYFPEQDESISFNDYAHLKYGATCHIQGQMKRPDTSRNPGQFDFRSYLAEHGIYDQVVVDSLTDISCTGSSIVGDIFTMRLKLLEKIKATFNDKTSAWLGALVLGDQSAIDEHIIDIFQHWGLSHLLAISGLHVGIVVLMLYFICIRLNVMTKETGEWLIIFILPLYAIIAGGEPSVWRASIMVVLFLIASKIKLNYAATDIISIVFLLLIMIKPAIVYHIGFQLSFAVTFGLILSRGWIAQSPSMLWQLLKISFVSQMTILPLQISYFHIFQPLSILLNLVVVPYFSFFVIPAMFILLILMPVSTKLINLCDHLFTLGQTLFIRTLQLIDETFSYPLVISDFPLIFTFLYYIIFIICMTFMHQNRLVEAFKYGCILTLLIICLTLRPYFSPVGTVTMLDIDQGDAFVIELPYRKGVFLIDAGATVSYENFEPTNKVYKNIIRPYLYAQGISHVDAIFMSHEDIDHNGSVPYIIEDMNVSNIYISDYYNIAKREYERLKEHSVNVKRLSFNEKITTCGQAFHVLSPKENQSDDNENSLVLLTSLGGKKWLFTGDIGKQTERKIVNSFPALQADVLKVAHHGSKTSTGRSFIKHINPKYALISAGVSNMYGHPHTEVLNTLQNEGVTTFRTDEDGAVQYHFKQKEGTFFKFLP